MSLPLESVCCSRGFEMRQVHQAFYGLDLTLELTGDFVGLLCKWDLQSTFEVQFDWSDIMNLV